LADFKQGKIQILIATDIASRGIDIDELPLVVNFDLPNVPEDYVHRIGRTGRAGSPGEAISLVSADEIKQLKDIERLIKKEIPQKEIESFEPQHALPKTAPKSVQQAFKKPQVKRSFQGASGAKHASQRRGDSQGTSFSKQRARRPV
jgi:ATP-dependent RNA helicase RhlE